MAYWLRERGFRRGETIIRVVGLDDSPPWSRGQDPKLSDLAMTNVVGTTRAALDMLAVLKRRYIGAPIVRWERGTAFDI